MGVLQAMSIADVEFPQRSESLYYLSVTAHGVLMALVFTTFFIMGLGYALAEAALGRITGRRTAWFAFWLATAGTAAAATTILRRQEHGALHVLPAAAGASDLLHRRHAAGRRVVDLGRRVHREHPIVAPRAPWRARCRCAIHGMLATIIIWYLATTGLAIEVVGMLIPWSLGWVETIDPLVARTLLLVVRPSARVLLAAAGLRAVVHGAAARRRAAGCSATRWRGWCSSCSSCCRRRSGSTISSPIPASAPAGSSRTRSRRTRSSIRASSPRSPSSRRSRSPGG